MTKKRLLLLTITFYLFFTSALLAQATTVRVGAILPLTGSLASVANAMRQGIELAQSESQDIKFKIIFEDDQTGNRTQAVTATKKLVSADKIDVLLNAYVSTLSVIYPITKRTKVPTVIIWDSSDILSTYGEYVVGFGYSNDLAGQDMAEFCKNSKKHNTTALIAFHDEWSELIAKAYKERFVSLGGKILLEENVNGGTTDFRTLILKAKAAKAECLYLPLFGNSLHSAIKQARELNYAGDILTADALGDEDIKLTGNAIEGVFLTQVWLDNSEFVQKYKKYFSSANTSNVNLGYVALGYDSLKLVEDVVKKIIFSGEQVTREVIAKALVGRTYEGVLGKVIIAKDGTTLRRQPIVEVKDQQFVKLAQ